MEAVRIGVIGLGEVAQIIHLPILQSLNDKFRIVALCDVSPSLLKAVGERYSISSLYEDVNDLVQQKDVDAVLVANSDEYHADSVIAALRNHKHVLVEKPMCLNLADAEAIRKARDESGAKVMVAYMRRFAPAFTTAVKMVRELDKILYVRVRDIIGQNRLIIEQSSNVLRFDDIPERFKADRVARAERMVKDAVGAVPPELARVYRLLCGLSSHDISAMRELIGIPKRILSAVQWNGGSCLLATFDYGDFCVGFETAIDQQRAFDAHIQIYSPHKSLTVQYDSPYIRHLPTTLVVRETIGESYNETVIRPTFKDPYTFELEEFYEVVTGKKPIKTTVEDAMEDLRIFQMFVHTLVSQTLGAQ